MPSWNNLSDIHILQIYLIQSIIQNIENIYYNKIKHIQDILLDGIVRKSQKHVI